MSREELPIQFCPLCISYMLDHPTVRDHKKCPSCGFSYKLGDEQAAREKAAEIKQKRESN